MRVHHREHARQQRGRMAQVGIDHADDRRRWPRSKPSTTAVPSPSLPARCSDGDAIAVREFVRECAGSVGRVVVDDDQLAVDAVGWIRSENRVDQIREPVALVVGGHDDGERGWAMARRSRMGLASTIIQARPSLT